MSTRILEGNAQVSPKVEQLTVQALEVEPEVNARTVKNRIPLTVRHRRVVRMAPPIDDGFRPFRVF